jgi:tRNA-dihydrouridine synthase 3
MASLRETLSGAVVLAPMTKGGNLPYRQLCVELGAKVLMGEMAVARQLKRRNPREFALVRRAPSEPFFGVQLAGTDPEEMAWAAALVEARGADLVDVNLGCPIDGFTRKGMGAALARQPRRVARIVSAMKAAVTHVPVTVKMRLGWNDAMRNYLDVARAAEEAGADAIFVHGRTRTARYRQAADWAAIAEVAAAVSIPVVGNGDLLFPHEIDEALRTSGCAGVMVGRGALVKPWIFREASNGYWDIPADERVALYRRYVDLAFTHWREDERGRGRVREFVRWHVEFWCRYAPRRPDGTWPALQQREASFVPRNPLEALLFRSDEAAFDYLTDALVEGAPIDPDAAPPRGGESREPRAEPLG